MVTDTGDIALTEGDSLVMSAAPAMMVDGAQVYLTPEEFEHLIG